MRRPDLRQFLSEITKLYELHIYTMGTRNYAEAVAKEIDPDKKYFKERILSRDESGSRYLITRQMSVIWEGNYRAIYYILSPVSLLGMSETRFPPYSL